MRLRLDPDCPTVRSWQEAERRDPHPTTESAGLTAAWRERHANRCPRCRDYLTTDAQLVLEKLLACDKAADLVRGQLQLAGFGRDIVEEALRDLSDARERPMTLEEFVATRKFCTNLGGPGGVDDDCLDGVAGFTYLGCYWIAIDREKATFSTVICNSEPASADLRDVERALHEFARGEP